MTCKFCGNEIEEGASFCFICGQPVEVEAPAEAPAPVAEPAAQPVYAEQPVAPQPEYAQPVYTQPAPEYVQPVPEYAQPVPEYVQPAPVATTGKKGKKAKDPNSAGKFVRFICFLFAIIGSIIYRKAVKAGNETKRVQIANAIFLGLDVKLAILNIALIVKFMI